MNMYLASAGSAATGVGATLTFILFGLAAVCAYFAPSIVAVTRKVPNMGSVVVINVLLGWTLIGWGVALAMACRSKYQAVMTPYQAPPRG